AELTSVQGTGIGLVIARRLTELMQGHLEVHSAPGQGTTCTVTLLAANAPPAPSAPPPAVATPAAAWDHTLQVLYVEDHASNIALVEAICKDRPGVSLSVVRSGQEALEHLAQHTPGLLLMDMN
ncbi:ATP-binding protein, partial [Leclercia adecarboxylata]|uniref:ATP-binding protein n=1 Tax=Leclercia adecarboxylata TaxID=83655 RepID=UPI00234DA99B